MAARFGIKRGSCVMKLEPIRLVLVLGTSEWQACQLTLRIPTSEECEMPAEPAAGGNDTIMNS